MTEIMPVPRNSHITVLRPPSIGYAVSFIFTRQFVLELKCFIASKKKNKINPFCGEYVINTATLCQILPGHIRFCFYKPLLPYLCQSMHIFKDGHSCHCRTKKDVRSCIIKYCKEKGD